MADNNMFSGQLQQPQQISQGQSNYNTVGQGQYNTQQPYTNPYQYSTAVNPYTGYQYPQQVGQQQNFWNGQIQNQQFQPINKQDDVKEYILLDGSSPNKKRKYVFVGEVDVQTNAVQPMPYYSLDDIKQAVKQTVAQEFDIRFGEEKKTQ